ncbi:MAG: hypothetical protein WDO12_05020 [Pseudomonadota bacterium]
MEGLRMHERQQIAAGVNEWGKDRQANVIINTCNAVFTIAILLVLGLLATRDIRRRNGFAADPRRADRRAHHRAARPEPPHEPRRRDGETCAGARAAR